MALFEEKGNSIIERTRPSPSRGRRRWGNGDETRAPVQTVDYRLMADEN
jgi:hypothetical protein